MDTGAGHSVRRTESAGSGVAVLLPPVLAALAGNQRALTVQLSEGATVAEVLDAVGADYPVMGRRVRDETGSVRRYVNLFLDGDNIRDLQGAATAVRPGQELLIVQSVAGG